MFSRKIRPDQKVSLVFSESAHKTALETFDNVNALKFCCAVNILYTIYYRMHVQYIVHAYGNLSAIVSP